LKASRTPVGFLMKPSPFHIERAFYSLVDFKVIS